MCFDDVRYVLFVILQRYPMLYIIQSLQTMLYIVIQPVNYVMTDDFIDTKIHISNRIQ